MTQPLPFRFSLEVFPGSSPESRHLLARNLKTLDEFGPHFISVTYGANGATRSTTRETVLALRSESATPTASHITCVDVTKHLLADSIEYYLRSGIDRFVALRGDPRAGAGNVYSPHPEGFARTADLVSHLRKSGAEDISVAAYPERHPESPSWEVELDVLEEKVDAGANRVLTQFFFDNQDYFRFRDRVRSRNIGIDLAPGIMPIQRFSGVCRFAKACGASIPPSIRDQFSSVPEGSPEHQAIAEEIAINAMEELRENGVHEFHIFTMNKVGLVTRILQHFLPAGSTQTEKPQLPIGKDPMGWEKAST